MSRWGLVKQMLESNKHHVVSLYAEGKSTVELGKIFGCLPASIHQSLKRWGVEIRTHWVVDDELRGRILSLYEGGMSARKIDNELGLKVNTANRTLKSIGLDISGGCIRREDPLVNHADEIIRRYLDGESARSLTRDYDCSAASIPDLLKKNGVAVRGVRYYAYDVDESFFDKIDNEQKSYVLGFFYGDGCNSPCIPSLTMSICDKDILEEIAYAMKYSGPLKERPPAKPTRKTQWVMQIGSRRLSDALERCGCVHRKTYVGLFPSVEIVPSELQRHFVRGLSDADGTITCTKCRSETRLKWSGRIVGNEAICRGVSETVKNHLGFAGSLYVVNHGAKHLTYNWAATGRHQLRDYLDWLYADATIFLKRKHTKYLEFLASLPPNEAGA